MTNTEILYDKTNEEHGIRVRVFFDGTRGGLYRAEVSCAVTGNGLGGVERCVSVQRAATQGWKHAERYYNDQH